MKVLSAPQRAPGALLAILLALAMTLTTLISARAHADLLSSDPAAGAILEVIPESVNLEFAENILTVDGSEDANQILVTNSDGERIDEQTVVVSGANVSTRLDQSAPNGSYSVVYRVVSADGHPIEGSFTFSVGEEDTNVIAPAPSTETGHSSQTQDWTIVFLSIVGLATAGALAFIYRRKRSTKAK